MASGSGSTDNAQFKIVGNQLQTDAVFDYESKSNYTVRVRVTDNTGLYFERQLTVHVANVNEPPSISLTNLKPRITEDTGTQSHVHVADILVADDALGSHLLALTGPDAGLFEIVENQLFLRAGVTLDAALKPYLHVSVEVGDSSLSSVASDRRALVISIVAATDAPAPLANPLNVTVASGGSSSILALSAIPGFSGSGKSISDLGEPEHGTVQVNTDGQGQVVLTYSPDPGFAGIDTVEYTVSDGNGGFTTHQVIFTVVNHSPVAADDHYRLQTGTVLNVNSTSIGSDRSSVLLNDMDADGQTLTASLVDGPLHGTLTFNSNGTFTYQADSGFLGLDSFTYQAFDGISYSSAATVSLDVQEGGDTGVVGLPWIGNASGAYSSHTGIRVNGGAFSIDPTDRFDPSGLVEGTTEDGDSFNDTSTETDSNGVENDRNSSLTFLKTTDTTFSPGGGWMYIESYTANYTVETTGSDDSHTLVSGSYSYLFTAWGDPTFTSYTFQAHTGVAINGEMTQTWGDSDEEQSGSMSYTWSQTDSTDLTVSNFTSLVTGVSIGSQSNSAASVLIYNGTGSYLTPLAGGSVSGTMIATGMQSTSTSLSASYSLTATGWLATGSGSASSLGNDLFLTQGIGGYSLANQGATSSSQVTGTIQEDSNDISMSNMIAAYGLLASGWELTTGSGSNVASGATHHSTLEQGTYSSEFTGGSTSGDFNGSSHDNSNYSSMLTSSFVNGSWLNTGTSSQSGDGGTNQSYSGTGNFATSSSSTGEGTSTSENTTGLTSEDGNSSSSYGFAVNYHMDGSNWALSSGTSSTFGSTSNSSSYTSQGIYSTSASDGVIDGTRSGSGDRSEESEYTISSHLENGDWIDSGSSTSSGSGSETSQFSGQGTYTAQRTLEDGTEISSSGIQGEAGGSSSDFSWQSASSLIAGEWIQLSGSGTSTGEGTSTSSSSGIVTYVRPLEGGSVSSTSGSNNTENSSNEERYTYSVLSNYLDGAWTDSGIRSDVSSFTNETNYEGHGSTHVEIPKANGRESKTDTIIDEDGMQYSFGAVSTSSVLNSTGDWEIVTGSSNSFTTGNSHNESTSTGTMAQDIPGGTLSGVTEGESSWDSIFDIELYSYYVDGEWINSGTRQDNVERTSDSTSDSYSDSIISNETDSSGTTYTITSIATQHSHLNQLFSHTSDSTLNSNGGWDLTSGSGMSLISSDSQYFSIGATSSSHSVEGGSVSGNTTVERTSDSTSSSNLTDSVVDGAWFSVGTGDDTSFQSREIRFEGSGSYSITSEDENGNSSTRTGTVFEESSEFESSDVSENSEGTTVPGLNGAESSFVWTQVGGSATDSATSETIRRYTSSVTTTGSITLSFGTYSGTVYTSELIGGSSTSIVESVFQDSPYDSTTDNVWYATSGSATVTATLGFQTETKVQLNSVTIDGATSTLSANESSSYTESQTESMTLNVSTGAWSAPTISETGKIKAHTDWNFHGVAVIDTSDSTSTTTGELTVTRIGQMDLTLNLNFSGTGENRTATGSGTLTGGSVSENITQTTGTYQRTVGGVIIEGTTESESQYRTVKSVDVAYTLSGSAWVVSSGSIISDFSASSNYSFEGEGEWTEETTSGGPSYFPGYPLMGLIGQHFGPSGIYDFNATNSVLTIETSRNLVESGHAESELSSTITSTFSSGQWVTTGTGTSTALSDYSLSSEFQQSRLVTGSGSDGFSAIQWTDESTRSSSSLVESHIESDFTWEYSPTGWIAIDGGTHFSVHAEETAASAQTMEASHESHGLAADGYYQISTSTQTSEWRESNLAGSDFVVGEASSRSWVTTSHGDSVSTAAGAMEGEIRDVFEYDEVFINIIKGGEFGQAIYWEYGTMQSYAWSDSTAPVEVSESSSEFRFFWHEDFYFIRPQDGWIDEGESNSDGNTITYGYAAVSFGQLQSPTVSELSGGSYSTPLPFTTPGNSAPTGFPGSIGFTIFESLFGSDEGGGEGGGEGSSASWPDPPSLGLGGYLYGVGQVFSGYYNAAVGTVSGVYQMARHPIQTATGIGMAIRHPIATITAIVDDYVEKAQSLEGQGEIVGEVLIGIATGAAGKALAESKSMGRLASVLRKIDKAVPDAAEGLNSASGRRYLIPNRIVQEEVEGYIARSYKEFEAAGGTFIEKWDELGPKEGIYRTLARTNVKERTITFYQGAELQDIVEELLHFKQAVRGGQWGVGGLTKLEKIRWEAQVDTLFRNLGMIPQ